MKKGLLSILAGALVLVGCQNYDDQFDNLESQISALASTVAGLSQVQSDLASLAGTVSSLASTVNGLGDTIDTAVADGLTDIQADIDAIETAVADVASSEEVAELQEAVDASEESLQELLDSSNVYSQDIIIKNVATLAFAKNLGNKLNIVNGNVALYITDDMATADVQEVASALKTITGNLSVLAKTSTIVGPTFANLTGVSDIIISQGGTVDFSSLASAGTITLGSDYKNKVTKVDFRSLANVTKFQQADVSYGHNSGGSANTFSTVITAGTATANTIDFPKSLEIHLTSLAYYTPGTLTIIGEAGHTLAIDVIDDVNALGTQTDLDLTITGAASVVLPNYSNGSFSATEVATVNLATYEGTGNTLTLSKVTNLTLGAIEVDVALSGSHLETVDITGALDADPNLAKADKEGPSVTFSSATGLETAKLGGVLKNINLTGAANLTSVDVSGVFADLTLDGNDDLTSITVAGSSYGTITVDDADDLETLTLGHEVIATKGTTPVTNGGIKIIDNDNLTSLSVTKANKVGTLHIYGNPDLATLDFDALTAINSDSATVVPSILIGAKELPTSTGVADISRNGLTAQSAQDKTETAAELAAKKDVGSFVSSAGLKDIKTYLGASVTANGTVYAQFDTVDSVLNNAGTEIESAKRDYVVVLNVKSDALAAPGSVAHVESYYIKNGIAAPEIGAINGFDPASVVDVNQTTSDAYLWTTEFVSDFASSYDAVGLTVTTVKAGAAVGTKSGNQTITISMASGIAENIAYGESIKIGVGTTVATIPIKHGLGTKTGSVTIAGVAVDFDTTTGSTVGTYVFPHYAGYSTTASGVGFVSEEAQLEDAVVAYLNRFDSSVPDYKMSSGTISNIAYDLGYWEVQEDAGETNFDIEILLTGVGTKALTGNIVADHVEAVGTTAETISRYTSDGITSAGLVHHGGAMLRFKAKNAGLDYEFNLSAPSNSATATIIDGFDDWDGADNLSYAPAAAAGANASSLTRSMAAEGLGWTTGVTTTAFTGTLTSAQKQAKASALGLNVDNYTDADFMHAADAGIGSVASNQATKENRTLWL